MRTKEECLKDEVKKSLNIDIDSRHWFVDWWMLLDPEPSLNAVLRSMEAYASQFSGSEPEGKEAVERMYSKEEFDDAVNEIGQLQEQLKEANEYIRDLQRGYEH